MTYSTHTRLVPSIASVPSIFASLNLSTLLNGYCAPWAHFTKALTDWDFYWCHPSNLSPHESSVSWEEDEWRDSVMGSLGSLSSPVTSFLPHPFSSRGRPSALPDRCGTVSMILVVLLCLFCWLYKGWSCDLPVSSWGLLSLEFSRESFEWLSGSNTSQQPRFPLCSPFL